jgi:hypothetical protein
MKPTPYKLNSITVTYKKTIRSIGYYMTQLERIDAQVQTMKDCKQASDILSKFKRCI